MGESHVIVTAIHPIALVVPPAWANCQSIGNEPACRVTLLLGG